MKITIISIIGLIIIGLVSYTVAQMGHGMMRGGQMMEGMHDHSPVQYNPDFYSEDMRISRGGQLYDNWWKTTTTTVKPVDNHPLWSQQNVNKRKGYSTYRCKECHGWDYKGKDGAYAKGSHYTGFSGVYEASQKKSVQELEGALKGSTNKEHDFSRYLSKEDISDLALFLKKGLINTDRYLDKKGNPIVTRIDEPILIPFGTKEITINQDGSIFGGAEIDQEALGQLKIVNFNNPHALVKEGEGFYKIKDSSIKEILVNDAKVLQGFTENSNANAIHEMTQMIETVRQLEAYQKIIQSIDEADDQSVNSLAQVA